MCCRRATISDLSAARQLIRFEPEEFCWTGNRISKWAGGARNIGINAGDHWSRLQREGCVGPTESYLVPNPLRAEWNWRDARAGRHNRGKREADAQIIHEDGRANAAGLPETPGRDRCRALDIIRRNRGVGFRAWVEPQLRRGGIDVIARDDRVRGVGEQIGSEHAQSVCAGGVADKQPEGTWGGICRADINPTTVSAADKMREIIGSIFGQAEGFEFEAGIQRGTVGVNVRTTNQIAADVFTLSRGDLELAASRLAFAERAGAIGPKESGVREERAVRV